MKCWEILQVIQLIFQYEFLQHLNYLKSLTKSNLVAYKPIDPPSANLYTTHSPTRDMCPLKLETIPYYKPIDP